MLCHRIHVLEDRDMVSLPEEGLWRGRSRAEIDELYCIKVSWVRDQ